MLSKQTIDNLEQYTQHYAEKGWVRIDNYLALDAAEQFHQQVVKLAQNTQDWHMATLVEGKAFIAKVNDYLGQPPQEQKHTIHVASGVYDPALGEQFPLGVPIGIELVGTGSMSTFIDGSGSSESLVELLPGSTNPWPIDAITVSPLYQLVPKRSLFHCLLGIRPERSPPRGNPRRAPRPSFAAAAAIRSIPRSRPTW